MAWNELVWNELVWNELVWNELAWNGLVWWKVVCSDLSEIGLERGGMGWVGFSLKGSKI